MRRFAELVIRYRWFVIAALAIISLVTIPRIKKLTVNNSIRIWFVEDDPDIIALDEFQDTFGGEEFGLYGSEGYAADAQARGDDIDTAARNSSSSP